MKYLKSLLYLIIFTFHIISISMQNNNAKKTIAPMNDDFFEEIMQDLFKDMSPEEQNNLFNEAMQLAQDMEKAGIDPNNIDEAIDFAINAIEKNVPENRPIENSNTEEPQVIESKQIQVTPVQVNVSDKEKINKLKITIKNLVEVLGEINFKAKELNFTSMLNNIFAIDLENYIQRLTIIENKNSLLEEGLSKLYNSLLSQYDDLKAFNADIIIPTYQDDNPYKILGLNFDSTDEEIKNKIQQLEKLYDSEEIKKTDNFKSLNNKNQNKILKHAQIELENAHIAYLQLKTSQDRKLTDKKISDTAQSSISQERKSKSALERVKKIIESKMYPTINDIDFLLKKYAPQEAATLKEKEEHEKKLLKDAEQQHAKSVQKTKDDIYRAKNLVKTPEDNSTNSTGKTFYQKYDAKRSNQPQNISHFSNFDDPYFGGYNQSPSLGNPAKSDGQIDGSPKTDSGKVGAGNVNEPDKDNSKAGSKDSKKSSPKADNAKTFKDKNTDDKKTVDFEIGQSLPIKAIKKLIDDFDSEFINPINTNQAELKKYINTADGSGTTDASNTALVKIQEIAQDNKLEDLIKSLEKAAKNIKKNKSKINNTETIITSLKKSLQPSKAEESSLSKLKSWADTLDHNAIPASNTNKDRLADWHQLTSEGQNALKSTEIKIPKVGERGFLGAIKLSLEKLNELVQSINNELNSPKTQSQQLPVIEEPVEKEKI